MENTEKSKISIIFSVENWIENILLVVASLSLIVMLGVTTYSILAREVFSSPSLWTNELAGYLMIYVVFLSAPWILRERGHVTVDLFLANLKGKVQKTAIVFISTISIIACFFYFIFSLDITMLYFNSGTIMYDSLPWPKYLLYLPIPIGSLFLIIRFLLIIIEVFINKNEEIEIFEDEGGL